jgi:hypothetical protein
MAAHAWIPNTWEAEAEGFEFRVSLGDTGRPCLKSKQASKQKPLEDFQSDG